MAYIKMVENPVKKSAKINFNAIDCELCDAEELFFNIFLGAKLTRVIRVNKWSCIPYPDSEKPDGYQSTIVYCIPSLEKHIGFHKIIKEEKSEIITSFEGPFLLYEQKYKISDEITVKEINYYESNIPKFTVKVYAIIYNEKNEILLIEKAGTEILKRKHCLPGGKVEKGESPLKALIREIKEETGLNFKREDFDFVHQMARKRKNGETLIYMFFNMLYINLLNNQIDKIKPEKSEENIIWANIYKLPENSVSYLNHILAQIGRNECYSEFGY